MCSHCRMTLRYVLENPRLEVFVPGLRAKISDVLTSNDRYLKKCGRKGPPGAGISGQELQSVRFQSETDNRENFPDAQTFQDFRKQRDMFYDILRGWKHFIESGTKPGSGGKTGGGYGKKNLYGFRGASGKGSKSTFPLEDNFGAEINALVTLQMNPVNMAHLAELFQVCLAILFS